MATVDNIFQKQGICCWPGLDFRCVCVFVIEFKVLCGDPYQFMWVSHYIVWLCFSLKVPHCRKWDYNVLFNYKPGLGPNSESVPLNKPPGLPWCCDVTTIPSLPSAMRQQGHGQSRCEKLVESYEGCCEGKNAFIYTKGTFPGDHKPFDELRNKKPAFCLEGAGSKFTAHYCQVTKNPKYCCLVILLLMLFAASSRISICTANKNVQKDILVPGLVSKTSVSLWQCVPD